MKKKTDEKPNDKPKKKRIPVPQITTNNWIEKFGEFEIRTILDDDGKLYFSVPDVVTALREGKDAKDYIKKLRKRDPELNAQWKDLVRFMPFETKGGRQNIKFADTQTLERVLRKVISEKKDDFNGWMAQKLQKAKKGK